MDILVQDYSLTHAAHMVGDDWTAGEMLETTLDDFLSWLRRRAEDPRIAQTQVTSHGEDEMLVIAFINAAGVTYAKTAVHSDANGFPKLKEWVTGILARKTDITVM